MGRPIIHFELGCRDIEKTADFYGKLFDWDVPVDGPTAMIETENDTGIGGHITSLGHEPHNYVLVYAQVDDLQSYLDKVEELGGKIVIPPTDVPEAGRFAWFADPEGTTFGLWQPLP